MAVPVFIFTRLAPRRSGRSFGKTMKRLGKTTLVVTAALGLCAVVGFWVPQPFRYLCYLVSTRTDPPFVPQTGSMVAILGSTITAASGKPVPTNRAPHLPDAWSSRVLQANHKSMYLLIPQGYQALQVSTGSTNFGALKQWLTDSLGPPDIDRHAPEEVFVAWGGGRPRFSVAVQQSNTNRMVQVCSLLPKRRQ
jgi:hypothetical protein